MTTLQKIKINGTRLLDLLYPVGSIYLSIKSTNPGTTFGGTWVIWGAGRVPLSVDSSNSYFNAAEKTGGEYSHTLTTGEMPWHDHSGYINIQHSDGTVVTGESLTSGLAIGGRARYVFTSLGSGENKPHNNIQPYITCYMWKRTA